MNNKGFTLIELLLTILLLSIIMSISYVSVTAAIKENNKNNCRALINNIKTAAKEYASDNRYNNDFVNTVSDSVATISLDNLLSQNYLKGPVINPMDKSTITSSSVTISAYLNTNYTVSYIEIEGISCE